MQDNRRTNGEASPHRPATAVLAWMRLLRIVQQVNRAASAQLRCLHLSVAHFDVLAQIGAAEGCTQQELADALLVTKGNITQLLDRMTACGLLERRLDGRTKRIFLTNAGRALRDVTVPAHEALITAHFSVLSAQEQVQLAALLRRLDRALRD